MNAVDINLTEQQKKIEKVLLDTAIKLSEQGIGSLSVFNIGKPVKYDDLFEKDVEPFDIVSAPRRFEILSAIDGACVIDKDGMVISYSAMIKNTKPYKNYGCRHCFDKDTEILTEDGWKDYKQIKDNDKVFTLNLKTNKIEKKDITKSYQYNYNGLMMNVKNRFMDVLVTPEHKMIFRKGNMNYKNRKIVYDSNLTLDTYSSFMDGKSNHVKQVLSGFKEDGLSIGKDKAGILGLVLTDCHISKKDKAMEITQSYTANRKKCDIIDQLLIRSGLKYTKHICNQICGYSKEGSEVCKWRILTEDSKWIFDWINMDRTPKIKLLDLRGDELEEIYKFMMLGDGSNYKKGNQTGELCSQNINRIDFFRTLCVMIGKTTKMVEDKIWNNGYTDKLKYRTHVSSIFNEVNIFKKDVTQKDYNGIVWCVENDNHTLIARRKGLIFFSGNSAAYTASMDDNLVIMTSEEDRKVRVFRNGLLIMQIDPMEKEVKHKTTEAVELLSSIGVGTLSTLGVSLAIPTLGLTLIPGIILFGGSHYLIKLMLTYEDEKRK
jgi:hypothetical protein